MGHDEILIQIVDENDKVIGAMPMDEAKQQGKIHRIARVMAEDIKGRILLQKRSSLIPYPEKWDSSAAGHVDEGETYELAAVREMLEEIGIKDVPLELLGTYYYTENDLKNRDIKQFNRVFKVELNITPTDLNKDEVSEVQWFDINNLKTELEQHPEDFVPALTEIIKRFY